MAGVLEFPRRYGYYRCCTDCVNAALSVNGIWCLALKETIWDDAVAEHCLDFSSQGEE